MGLIFAGIDGEMTGSNVSKHKLIQIGIAFSKTEVFVAHIGWQSFDYDPEALEVIGVNREDIYTWPEAAEVDRKIVAWLEGKGIEKRSIIPVGWEVAAFDRPFIKEALPNFYEYLHYHSVELNSIAYTFGGVMPYLGDRPSSREWKKMAKFAGVFCVKCEEGRWPKEHDAGDDAILSLESWRWLRNIILDDRPGHLAVTSKKPTIYGRIESIDATKRNTHDTLADQ